MKYRRKHLEAGGYVENREAWEKLYEEAVRETDRYQEFKGTLGRSADRLFEGLSFDDSISQKIERLYVYAECVPMRTRRDSRPRICFPEPEPVFSGRRAVVLYGAGDSFNPG